MGHFCTVGELHATSLVLHKIGYEARDSFISL